MDDLEKVCGCKHKFTKEQRMLCKCGVSQYNHKHVNHKFEFSGNVLTC